ncbi:hypothetical protein A9Z42_0011500 [Trichoderma parareesei]|uniref:F-box domain-containing protein n=1 Tax=Trichoderma parareesei TaxID=858221 RepID=A0A2H2YYF6_TRIPA|nr:hypothetical protein A9Z42_0011500 [Trichoderma parareesei]
MASNIALGSPLQNSRLEGLPCLIQHNVLTMLDLCDIDSLARASPVLYQLVKRDRASLIYRRLKSTLGSVLVDAYAAYQTSFPPWTDSIRDLPVVEPFLESYANSLRFDKPGPSIDDLGEKAIIGMWTFHTTIVEPLIDVYARMTLEKLSSHLEVKNNIAYVGNWIPDGDGPDVSSPEPPLSPTERMRILRAMYRFQLHGHIFGSQGRTRPRFEDDPYVSIDDVTRLFFNLFEPWEFEEIASFEHHAYHVWNAICMTFGDEIRETSPLFEFVSPPAGKRLMEPCVMDHVVAGTVSRGLRPLHAISFVGGDAAKRIKVMHEVLAWPTIEFNCISIWWSRYFLRYRKHNPTERDWKEVRGDRLPFNGDGESDELHPRPPAAWVMLWRGRYSNVRSVHWQLHDWGYVMWDKERIDATGAGKILYDYIVEHSGFGTIDYPSSEEDGYDSWLDDEVEFEETGSGHSLSRQTSSADV